MKDKINVWVDHTVLCSFIPMAEQSKGYSTHNPACQTCSVHHSSFSMKWEG